MRIALDLSPLVRPFPLGVQRVVRSALAALEVRPDVEVVGVRPPDGTSLALWRQTTLVRDAAAAGADVLHSWTSAFPLRAPMPVTQTVHEAPWRHGAGENAGPIHRLWARLGRARADLVITPSARVAKDLGAHRKLRVVPWGVGPEFTDVRVTSRADLAVALPELPDRPFVLCLGGTRPKKRLDLVLAAAARAGVPVVCTGPRTPESESLAERHAHLVVLGTIEERHVPGLLRTAGCVAILSTSEGFGLPALESLGCGTPVVVPRDSVQAGTAAGFGFEVDTADPNAVFAGISAALAVDVEDPRRAAGMAHARAFTWERTADALDSHWRSLL